jgi:ribosomal protein S27AE
MFKESEMVESRVQCPACGRRIVYRYNTRWECGSCGRKYRCVQGVPKLYLEECIGKADKDLRDRVYSGIAGRFYKFMMPFLTIPARPIKITLRHWLVYFLLILILGFLVYRFGEWVFQRELGGSNGIDILLSMALGAYVLFLWKHPYVAYLLLLAVPVKVSLAMRPFKPQNSFGSVHAQFQEEYQGAAERIKLLDVATGTCNSLYKHGWMGLRAEYTAVDLSESISCSATRPGFPLSRRLSILSRAMGRSMDIRTPKRP